ncbi:hypothetical protein BOO69_16855 [Sulfitobacter alexandrii]|uniref:Mucoidy inhibitor MuiA family protein n=1 Tax=Sulfitobacter alexandrii TaxID=1917485 RepID=A0A1J0WL52_9RHOB|nr:DUF4139 domain-containing protein [Sulfitobacter alexandrii]APE44888.1 hypothetical protein BOO69_16855 [Sulfitobacter alexandrii]
MRVVVLCLLSLPAVAQAETFTLSSAPTSAVVYGYGAQVTREVSVTVPAGTHDLVLPDLPAWMRGDMLRVSVDGARLGSTQFRSSAVPPQPERETPEVAAAKERIEAAERALTALDDRVAEARLAAAAAEAKAGFLGALGTNEGLPSDVATLADIARLVETETLAAEQAALTARQRARDIEMDRDDLVEELEDAKAALAALTPPAKEVSQLTLSVTAETEGDVTLSLSYPVDAGWRPVYDLYLRGEEPATLDIVRGAMIAQYSGENWDDVSITLSTLEPASQISPTTVRPQLRRIEEPEPPRPMSSMRKDAEGLAAAEPVMEAPVMADNAVATSFDGPGVTYSVTQPLDLASGVDATRVNLDRLSFDARRFAHAAPAFDRTAYLMAEFTNTTQEPLLAASEAALYIDNTLVGRSPFPQVPAGAEGDVPFGPIDDLQLSYTILDQSEGDRGIISRSNAQRQRVRMDVENLGTRDWTVEVQAAVPYTIQDDLSIQWTATPQPDERNVEDLRGVLQWNIDVPAGETREIEIQQELNWPDGMVLR